MPQGFTRRAIGGLLAATILLIVWRISYYEPSTLPGHSPQGNNNVAKTSATSRKVGKVSMLYGYPNPYYKQALESHKRHADRWGYPMHILQEDISEGFWNKPSYVLSLVIQELAKPAAERLEWLMWVDADSIIINPAIPADIFLPPRDLSEIHFVASKDQNGLNTGIVFFHVHQWTISMLIEALAHPLYLPAIDLGVSADQEAMARIMKKTTDGPDGQGYAQGMAYLPRPWINTYEWHHAYEGKKGDMLVHFPGLEDDRWPHMEKWLGVVEDTPLEWEVPLKDTEYPRLTKDFWDKFRTARNLANQVERDIYNAPAGSLTHARQEAVAQLRIALQQHADEAEFLQQCVDDLHAAIKKETSA
ncbi:hypothetical protein BGW36DRAFT_210132 [Talaromyces proteolyticus]|uniref:Galactosyl transferase GMA12/MNN10 family protein n=1 Tax=Talaromyces proteolyticus TaxID=1131652 RepID=A0AAD4KPE6_9EURO|nr:uncharacterized protein BGW36DRAFT_210132 [Talaromyces proteolyticus]KAH8693753.1 hypothetical protein BGW36DRAFT_210132 [Talaromyces proteolyticus]